MAAVVGGTFFVQKSSNHVLNKTSIGKFHEAEEHTATGVVVCKTEALQEVFQQKKEEVLLAKQEVPDESEGKNEKTDKKGTQEVTLKGTNRAGINCRRAGPFSSENATTSGDRNLSVEFQQHHQMHHRKLRQHHQRHRRKLRQHHQIHRQKLRQRHRQNSRQRKQNQQIHARIRFGQ